MPPEWSPMRSGGGRGSSDITEGVWTAGVGGIEAAVEEREGGGGGGGRWKKEREGEVGERGSEGGGREREREGEVGEREGERGTMKGKMGEGNDVLKEEKLN